MTTAIIDTNVLVQSLISSPPSASARVLDVYFDGFFRLQYTSQTVDELIDVLALPRIRAMHELSDDEILEFVASLLVRADLFPDEVAGAISAELTRDVSDTKFLALARDSNADFLVTNDRRHLQRTGRFGRTEIVGPGEFIRRLGL